MGIPLAINYINNLASRITAKKFNKTIPSDFNLNLEINIEFNILDHGFSQKHTYILLLLEIKH